MTKKFKFTVLTLGFVFMSAMTFAQTPAKGGDPAKAEDEFANKKVETKLSEVVPTDSLPASELVKRANAWIKAENLKYKKSGGTTSGGKVECTASFRVKPKELNPEVDYTGKITMKVVIECKDSKYKYTVSEIRHTSNSGNATGGSVDNAVAESGSMAMNDIVWKKLKGEAMRGAGLIVADLKAGMAAVPSEVNPEEW